MTGFARAAGSHGAYSWTWELKSVNSRGLDLRCRLQGGLDGLEVGVRAAAARRFHRGSISLNLSLLRTDAEASVRVNQDVLAKILAAASQLGDDVQAAPPTIDGLLALRGVIETVEPAESDEQRQELEAAIQASLEEALDRLTEGRQVEGGRLSEIVGDQLDAIARLTGRARDCAEAQPEALKQRLRQQVADLLEASAGLSEERLMQEAALLATKADVREEVDRLTSHITAAGDLLSDDGAIGRRLDFLAQEFNREANTLCSKSQDVELTGIGIELKTVIDQFREQSQNIE
ncbi:MAG: YicC/YloC family endoribonuclease [Alphaproteobacteria bacterium]|jgi:uncharacterized protein (TIGR00255 family)|nr:YicC/YloC family endoribonuclease [Alphaproteobacteria bacterium]MDP6565268.1 YicC/YloC family endoribonuclease [Alphaproteobacteria bacterium]MDP6813399.1 YicC/YloC family endoribonuclease [Alphaproteobacteria bacterium]